MRGCWYIRHQRPSSNQVWPDMQGRRWTASAHRWWVQSKVLEQRGRALTAFPKHSFEEARDWRNCRNLTWTSSSYLKCPYAPRTSGTRRWGSRWSSGPPGYTGHRSSVFLLPWGRPLSLPGHIKETFMIIRSCHHSYLWNKMKWCLTARASNRWVKQNTTRTWATLSKISLENMETEILDWKKSI